MSQLPINIGQAPNDGQGDELRVAFAKTISNLADLNARLIALAQAGSPTTDPYVLTSVLSTALSSKANVGDLLNKLNTNGDGQAVTVAEPSSGAIARSLLNRALMQPLDAMAYGVKADGTTDDAAAIRAAIAAARTRVNRTVLLPAGTICIGSTISTSDWSNIRLIGAGRGALPGAVPNTQSSAQDATILKWTGASGGVMVDTQSPSANRPYLTAALHIAGVVLDGNGLAGTGLYTRGMVNSRIEIKFRNVTSVGYDLDVYSGGGADVQGNIFDIQGDLDYTASTTANGWVIGPGSSYNNVHHNWIQSVRIITRNGTGWVVGNADSNVGANVQVNYPYQAGGNVYTGIGMDFRAAPNALGPGGVTQAARSNVFFGVSNFAPTYARAGSFGLPSYGNVLYGYIQDSAEPNPVIETGASLDWYSALGGFHVKSLYPGQQVWKSPGDYEVMFQNQAGAIVGYIGTDGIMSGVPTDSLRIRNDKGGGIGSGSTPAIMWDTSNNITFPSIRSFASNSAARSASPPVPVGGLYFNTGSGSLSLAQ